MSAKRKSIPMVDRDYPILTKAQIRKIVGKPKSAVQTMAAVERLVGDERVWIKHTEEVDNRAFCLMGGVRYVDGPSVGMIEAAVALAIAQLYPGRVSSGHADSLTNLKLSVRETDSVLSLLSVTDGLNQSSDVLGDSAFWFTITHFNDHPNTTLKDVRRVLSHARKKVLPLIQSLSEHAKMIKDYEESATEVFNKLFILDRASPRSSRRKKVT